jgi:hypothetical protein
MTRGGIPKSAELWLCVVDCQGGTDDNRDHWQGPDCVTVADGGKDLAVPDNLSLIALPPYAPELNPVENV